MPSACPREWSDSSCTTRRTGNVDTTDGTLFLHSEMGGVAFDICHHPPDQRGQMSYKMTCAGDTAVQTMWQGPVCGDLTDMAGQNPNAGACQCAAPSQVQHSSFQSSDSPPPSGNTYKRKRHRGFCRLYGRIGLRLTVAI